MGDIEIGFDDCEGMYYAYCGVCDSEVFGDTEDQAEAAAAWHLDHGHVWEFDAEEEVA